MNLPVDLLQHLQTLVGAINDVVWLADLEGTLIYVNDAVEAVYGRTAAEFMERSSTWFDAIYPEDKEKQAAVEQEMWTEGGVESEYRILHTSGEIRWLSDRKKLIRNAEGTVTHIGGIATDITARKNAETVALEREAMYRSTVEDQTELIERMTPDGRILMVNDAYCRYYNRSREGLIGGSIYDFVPEELQPALRQKLSSLTPELPALADEHLERRGDGEWRWMEWVDRGIFDAEGNLVEILAVGRDIHARIEALQKLEKSEYRYRTLAEETPYVMALLRDGVFIYVNPAGLEMMGGEQHEVIGRAVADFVLPEVVEMLRPDARPLADGGRRVVHFSARMLNGTLREIEGIVCHLDFEGKPTTQFIGRDVTEERLLEDQLRQLRKMEALGQLAGGIAHDFNNLLVPIIGYTELALLRVADQGKVADHLMKVRETAARAASLTQQILAFSRKQVLELRVINLNEVVTEFQSMLSRLIRGNIEISLFQSNHLFLIEADKSQIEQIVLNLVINARDAMPTGGRLIIETDNVFLDEAYVARHPEAHVGDHVMLAVSDTGVGISPEVLEHIFEPFFTTKEMGKGSGLGLATVHGIVKQHRGNIRVYSEEGKGTTIKVYLPKAANEDVTADTMPAEDLSLHGTELVLVVEDEVMVRKLVCECLEVHGYKVLEATNPAEALRLATEANGNIDLLLTDVIMPHMNGRELYKAISAVYPAIKVLYTSGYTNNVIMHQGILKQGINFLQKPFPIRLLLQKVRESLAKPS